MGGIHDILRGPDSLAAFRLHFAKTSNKAGLGRDTRELLLYAGACTSIEPPGIGRDGAALPAPSGTVRHRQATQPGPRLEFLPRADRPEHRSGHRLSALPRRLGPVAAR